LRIGDTYVDPMILFQPIDLTTAVHLAPTASDGSGMGFVDERRSLVDGLRTDDAPTVHPARRAPTRWRPLVRWRYL
jgi:hypothetical protein